MTKRSQLLLVIGAVVLVIILFQLPRSVVENDQLQELTTESHSMEVPQEVKNQFLQLRTLLDEEKIVDKKINFAHSLARGYLDYGVLDSAIRYAKAIEEWSSEPSRQAADIYFTAFERSASPEEGKVYAEKTRSLLEQLMEKDPSDYFLKNRLAMTLVASENPMSGVLMLREILVEDENNRQAILNLGLLAIQSGQFDRAKERFENLVSLDSTDHESKLYLAVSLIEIEQQLQARLLLEEILASQDSIPAIKVMANDYLQML